MHLGCGGGFLGVGVCGFVDVVCGVCGCGWVWARPMSVYALVISYAILC